MISLVVTPEVSLADENVRVRVCGLQPQQLITLRAWVKDEKGHVFSSVAFYISDTDGVVDLDHTPAVGGNYKGIYPMGLFWALKPVNPYLRLIKRDVMGSPFYINLEVYLYLILSSPPENPPEVSKVLERWYVAPGVKRIQIREGRVRGALFLPPGDGPFPGVIDMFGGIGGLLEFRSSLLASRGFASLALAYFAYEDLPNFLGHVDLTYFEEAAELLLKNPKVSGDGVGVVAICKGAEIALAMATYLPQVKATVCINGTNAINGNSMSYGDVSLCGIPYHIERVTVTDIGVMSLSDTLADTRDPAHQDCILPLEKARGSILFIVGEEDQNYDSLKFAKEALARARKHGKNNVHLKSFPRAGHLLEPPGSPFCPVSQSPFFPLPLMWGGELLAHCSAQEISWREMQDFFRKNLNSSMQSKL
ncbi:acyl-coenzyme A amino acid N-acyltransferase 1 [Bombina bombina]|uniref:acyl-coenzyme A amino acid N-acyltransferase 1 n=1 Tax=Bombina bombina TaxID=8345 RepID=UPI00235B3018|nr:acyl-coenzyme A amino acid N-acyltransferase 1 [Bombina bombina]